jgi:uncharacterized protein YjbJ (UPF0337 family)
MMSEKAEGKMKEAAGAMTGDESKADRAEKSRDKQERKDKGGLLGNVGNVGNTLPGRGR